MVFTVINQRDVYNVLDIGKVADIIVFVMSCADAQVDKLRDDPNTYANAIDEEKDQLLYFTLEHDPGSTACQRLGGVLGDLVPSRSSRLRVRHRHEHRQGRRCDSHRLVAATSANLLRHHRSVTPAQTCIPTRLQCPEPHP